MRGPLRAAIRVTQPSPPRPTPCPGRSAAAERTHRVDEDARALGGVGKQPCLTLPSGAGSSEGARDVLPNRAAGNGHALAGCTCFGDRLRRLEIRRALWGAERDRGEG